MRTQRQIFPNLTLAPKEALSQRLLLVASCFSESQQLTGRAGPAGAEGACLTSALAPGACADPPRVTRRLRQRACVRNPPVRLAPVPARGVAPTRRQVNRAGRGRGQRGAALRLAGRSLGASLIGRRGRELSCEERAGSRSRRRPK